MSKRDRVAKKITIGRKDKAQFPEFGFKDIGIKMDTGAYTSAIHCHEIRLNKIDGRDHVIFKLLDPSHAQYQDKEISTDNFHLKRIKNSFGISEKRFVIETSIRLFKKDFPIQLSLSQRGEMKFPVLIGRRFLMGQFIVDSSKYDLSYKNLKNKL